MKYIVITAAVAVLGIFTGPLTSNAFSKENVERSAIAKTETGLAAYQVSFTIGSMRESVRIPVVGQRNLENGARTNRFGYELIAEREPIDGVAQNGTSTALLISNAPIVDGMYEIAAGAQYRMTILGVYKIDSADGNEYRFKVTELPFYLGKEMTPQHFTPSELKYFYTEAEDLYYDSDAGIITK